MAVFLRMPILLFKQKKRFARENIFLCLGFDFCPWILEKGIHIIMNPNGNSWGEIVHMKTGHSDPF